MRNRETGKKLCGVLLIGLLLSGILSGCAGTAKYQVMELEQTTEAEMAAETAEPSAISAAGVGSVSVKTDLSAETEEAAETEVPTETEETEEAGAFDEASETGERAELQSLLEEGNPPEAGEISQAADNGDEEAALSADGELMGNVRARAAGIREEEIPWNGYTVAIDAGHQAKANSEKEPIGPDSKTMKAKMPEGSSGTVTGIKEYELTLTVAQRLDRMLREKGYHTVMIRTGHDVNLGNEERANIANKSGADVVVRLHANSMENSGIYGALSICMTDHNPYNAELHSKSYSLSKKIIDSLCGATGTKNRGVQEADNYGEINWSKIPVSVVEMGFLSNPDEEKWLQDENYQEKLASGIVSALDSYFAEQSN